MLTTLTQTLTLSFPLLPFSYSGCCPPTVPAMHASLNMFLLPMRLTCNSPVMGPS